MNETQSTAALFPGHEPVETGVRRLSDSYSASIEGARIDSVRNDGVDGEVVRRAQAGDAAARDELGRAASQIAYPFALQLLGRPELAKDVAQDALLRLFRTLERVDPDKPLAPWLRRIVRNRAIDVIRHGKIRRHESLDADVDGRAPIQVADTRVDVAGTVQLREQQALLFRALDDLPEAQREIVVLRDYQDLSYGEISEMLSIPQGTVMSRLHRARKALRERLRGRRSGASVSGESSAALRKTRLDEGTLELSGKVGETND